MEKAYIAPEELSSRFRCKKDLYTQLTVDCKFIAICLLSSGVISSFIFKMSTSLHKTTIERWKQVSTKLIIILKAIKSSEVIDI